MKHKNRILKLILFFAFIFGGAQAIAKSKKTSRSASSIKEAMERSNLEQQQIKQRMYDQAHQRFDRWSERQDAAITIDHRTSSLPSLELASPDLSMEELGSDDSGLDSLRSDVEQESTDINFDDELREVSSMKDS